MPDIAIPARTCGFDSAIEVRWPPADQPASTIPAPSPPRRQSSGEIIDPGVDFAHDLVERRVRRQRVAGQCDVDAMGHRAAGKQRKGFLGARLPITAMDEEKRRRGFPGLEEIDPIALARAISQVEMIGILRPHLEGTPIPAGDEVGAGGHVNAIVEAEVALLLAHAAPVGRV